MPFFLPWPLGVTASGTKLLMASGSSNRVQSFLFCVHTLLPSSSSSAADLPPLPLFVPVAVVPVPSREWRRQSRSTAESAGWWKELPHHRALCIPSPWRRATGRRTKCKPATSLPACVYLLLLCTFCVRFCVAIRHREATEA
jgi:hypothetical protein